MIALETLSIILANETLLELSSIFFLTGTSTTEITIILKVIFYSYYCLPLAVGTVFMTGMIGMFLITPLPTHNNRNI